MRAGLLRGYRKSLRIEREKLLDRRGLGVLAKLARDHRKQHEYDTVKTDDDYCLNVQRDVAVVKGKAKRKDKRSKRRRG